MVAAWGVFLVGRGGNASAVAEYSILTGGRFQAVLLKVLIVLGSKLLRSVATDSRSLKIDAYLEVLFAVVGVEVMRMG